MTPSNAVWNGSAKRLQSLGIWPRTRCRIQPWHKIRAFGNVLRHEYDEIGEEKLFEIVKGDLPGLYAAAEEALAVLTAATD